MMRILLPIPVVLFFFPAALCAQPGAFDKAKPAWNLPWDADWVTAVSFVGPNRVAAGNNLGDILIWDLPRRAYKHRHAPAQHAGRPLADLGEQ
jgi:hypothetical protein